MKRNMERIIEETRERIPTGYDLTFGDIQKLRNESSSSIAAILDSFAFGYAQGMKAAKAKMRKRGIK